MPPISDYLPDFSNSDEMAAWGAIGNMLIGGSAPRYAPNGNGITGGNKLNSLAALAGMGMTGAVQGANGAQAYQQEQLANQNSGVMNPIAQQTAQLGLDKQQALQPLQIGMIKNALNSSQGGGSAPFGMPSSGSGSSGAGIDAADMQFAQAYQLAMASGDMAKAAGVLQSWAEHNPQLAGRVKNEEARNSIVALPGGRQVPGSQIMPAYGSPAPSIAAPQPMQGGSSSNIPMPQPPGSFNGPVPPSAQPVPASQLFPQSSMGINPNDPVEVAAATEAAKAQAEANVKVATAGPVKSAEDQGANLAEAQKAYSVMQSNFPMLQQRIQDLTKANDLSSFGPPKLANGGVLAKVMSPLSSSLNNDAEGNGPITAFHASQDDPVNSANVRLKQTASQGILPEMSSLMGSQNLKGNKYLEGIVSNAGGIDLTTSKTGRQTQINGLAKQYVQSMVAAHDMIANRGGTPDPLPPEVVRAAVQYGTMSKKDAKKYLLSNHAAQFGGDQ